MKRINPLINFTHSQQDVYGARQTGLGQSRYVFARRLLPQDGKGLRLLEVGGGMAEFSQMLNNSAYKVTFTDLNSNSVANAKSLGFESYQIDFNFGLPGIPDNSFDVVVMLEVIEHIVNAEHLITEVRRVLSQDGVLVLSTPNFAFWSNRLRILFGNLPDGEGYHYRFFTRQSLEHQLQKTKLVPEAWEFSSPAFGINIIRNRILGHSRLHVHIPDFFSPIFAQTLFVRARKCISATL